MRSIRELDALDMALLMDAEVLLGRVPKNSDEKQRLARLEKDGYVAMLLRDGPDRNQTPASFYVLAPKGKQAVSERRNG